MAKWLALFLITFSLPAQAQELKVLFGTSRPPYINQRQGLVFDLIQKILVDRLKYQIQPEEASNARLLAELDQDHFDVIVEVQPGTSRYHLSKPFVYYQNFIVTKRPLKASQDHFWDAYQSQSVCAWQGATEDLGPEFKKATHHFKKYQEFGKQYEQVLAWIRNECEAMIIDKRVFSWLEKQILTQLNSHQAIAPYQTYFGPLDLKNSQKLWWYVAFKDFRIRDAFNRELAKINLEEEFSKTPKLSK